MESKSEVEEMEKERELVLREVLKALRLARKYKGKFSSDELEYAEILLEELEEWRK